MLGLGDLAWLSDADLALYAVALTDIWMWAPFVMLLSLAGLSAVPQHLYEAAAIDRAGSWYTFFHITLPLVSPLLLIALIFRTMEAFKTFDIAYILSTQPTTELVLDQALQVRVPGMADRQVLCACLHCPDHGAGDYQHLREISQQGEGALVMAVVTSSRKKVWNWVAIAAVLVIAIAFLSPLYWIGSTAFKPRSLATTVPPTVFFQPEITPFIKLFTKRVQLTKPVDPAVYDAAPWYEKRIYDGGERILRVGPNIQLSQYPNRFMNSLIVAIISTFIAVSMGRSRPMASRGSRWRRRIGCSSSCRRACSRPLSSQSRCT